jgi:hypothetical protein
LYDVVFSSGLIAAIIDAIPEEEYNMLIEGIYDSVEAVYKYQNSVLGILEVLKGDMSDIENIDIEGMKTSLAELAESPMLKQIIPLLGLEQSIEEE